MEHSGIPQHEIEHIARCILPDVLAYYESEEGQREFQEWLVQRGTEQKERRVNNRRIIMMPRAPNRYSRHHDFLQKDYLDPSTDFKLA